MRSIQHETKQALMDRRNFVNYADMTLSDGTVLHLGPSDFRIKGNTYTDDLCESTTFQLGSAIGKTCNICLDNTDGREEVVNGETVVYKHGKFSGYDFYMSYFTLKVVLPQAYHYNGELRDEVITIGTFTVTNPVSTGSTIEITAVDNMYLFDRAFDECNLDFSLGVTLSQVLNKCCTDCKVPIGYSTFDFSNNVVREKPEGCTYRQIVSYIAQIAGCNAVIDVNGALKLKPYDMRALDNIDGGTFDSDTPYSTGAELDGGSFSPWDIGDQFDGGDFVTSLNFHNLYNLKSCTVSTDDIVFTGVSIKINETEMHVGSTDTAVPWDYYAMVITDNKMIPEDSSTMLQIATSLYNKLKLLRFRAFDGQCTQDPTIEAGDCAVVYDIKGNMYNTIITNVSFSTGGYTNISCKAESPLSQKSRYINPAAQAVSQATKKMSEYNTQVAHFNELANAALGYYKTEQEDEETGSTITYIHDKPTLGSSRIIWKISAEGIFISEDGGTSYNAGLDTSTATMLMNLVYAHGVTCDWIHSGTLTLGGDNDVDGVCSVNDAEGTEVVRLDSEGINVTKGTINGPHIRSESANDPSYVNIQGGRLTVWTSPRYSKFLTIYEGASKYIDAGGDVWGATTSSRHVEASMVDVLGAFADNSDIRIKRNIEDLDVEESKELVLNAKVHKFNIKDYKEKKVGVIAQEVIEQLDKTGTLDDNYLVRTMQNGMYRVEYEQYIPHLINVIKYQQDTISSMQKRLDELDVVVNSKK